MKSQTPMLMLALAIIVIVAVALTVALICMNRTEGPLPNGETTVAPSDATLPIEEPTQDRTELTTQERTEATLATERPSTEATTAAPQPILPDVSNGLSFVSYGDGTCKVGGIGTCVDACVVIPEYSPMGDRVIEIGLGAFFECSTVTAIQIPSTVQRIGELAFGACRNLVYISVSEENAFYCDVDGVLYSEDMSTLLAYPPMRAGDSMTIHATTTVIKEMAFRDCVYLKTVHYTGTAEQWDSILIGARNYSLTAASMTFANAGK